MSLGNNSEGTYFRNANNSIYIGLGNKKFSDNNFGNSFVTVTDQLLHEKPQQLTKSLLDEYGQGDRDDLQNYQAANQVIVYDQGGVLPL